MEPEIIDWDSIESVFVEDDDYENLCAPKWVDFTSHDFELSINDDSWFCKPDCRHPKTVEDYLRLKNHSKLKLLRSVSISDMLSFKNKTPRDATVKNGDRQILNNFGEYDENKNPNSSAPPQDSSPASREDGNICSKQQLEGLLQVNASRRRLRSTFSARNLLSGKEILNQITQVCCEFRKMATRGSKKKAVDSLPNEDSVDVKVVKEKERVPLLEVNKKGLK